MYFRKAVHLKRALDRLLRPLRGRRGSANRAGLLNGEASKVRTRCVELYVLMSSNVRAGFFLGLAIATMAVAAKIFSVVQEGVHELLQEGGQEESEDSEIDKIFN